MSTWTSRRLDGWIFIDLICARLRIRHLNSDLHNGFLGVERQADDADTVSMDYESRHRRTMLVEIRGYAADECRHVHLEFVIEPESLTPEWWDEVVFPLAGDGRHPRTVTMEVATVVMADTPEFVGATMEWQG